jgi:CRP-like cAMP-binding protein
MQSSLPQEEANWLLGSLSEPSYRRVADLCEIVETPREHLVSKADAIIPYAYFPQSGCLSVISVVSENIRVEVGTVGWEGMTGLSFLHGVDSTPTETFAQVPGRSKRIPREAFKRELVTNPELAAVMNRYAQFWTEQSSRSISCNSVHTVEARCARWLLSTHDRVESDVLLLTQEFLAIMLAVRRASVSVAAESLRKAGLISYSRGKITVLDRHRLEAASCDCYAAIQSSYDRLLPSRKRRRT